MSFKINIPESANKLIQTLQDNGFSAYVVGGCVRDSLMERRPHDWDICTSAKPEQMLGIFKDYKVIETGIKHGTVTIVIDREQYECTTFRIDGDYTDKRRPDNVTFTEDLITDLSRRDFTVNAMAYNDREGLIDPFGGVEDIKENLIRCVGRAKDRFEEDALRIMRAIRFASQLNFTIETDTAAEVHSQRNSLRSISAERVRNEFCSTVMSHRFDKVLREYKDVFAVFIPELERTFGFQQNNPYHDYDVFEHTVHAIENCESEDLITRLAVLFHDIGKPIAFQDGEDGRRHFKGHADASMDLTDGIMRRLRFDNATRASVLQLIMYHDSIVQSGVKSIKRRLNKMGKEQFWRLLEVREADIRGQKKLCNISNLNEVRYIRNITAGILLKEPCFTLKDLAINGKDLIEIGFEEGLFLGKTLQNLLEDVMDNRLANEREPLLQAALFYKEQSV